MVARKIMVSMPEEDKSFCISRALSPSKLLQERITQIRDENNPSLVKEVLELHKKIKNSEGKLEFLSYRLQQFVNITDSETAQKIMTS